MRPHRPWGFLLQSSWVATVLAGALTVTTPVAATLAGAGSAHRAASTPPREVAAHDVAPAGQVLGGGPRQPDPSSFVPATRVLAEHGVAPTPRPGREDAPASPPYLLVDASPGLVARAAPWAGAKVIAEVPSVSRYYHVPLRLWVEEVRGHGAWGLVEIPYAWPHREGWIALGELRPHHGRVTVHVDLSDHMVVVERGDDVLRRFPGATGTASSPTPPGDYVVTDRVPFPSGSVLGSFAFGISGIQPRLPSGWSGGDQLAIHGTNAPWTIGTSASAGCIRVSETALDALLPLLRRGTPVLIRP
jgi:hypothetical protein